jgi:hypothetical protein
MKRAASTSAATTKRLATATMKSVPALVSASWLSTNLNGVKVVDAVCALLRCQTLANK